MNYQPSSRSQKKRSPAGSDTASSSRKAAPTTSVPPSLRYFTAAASSSLPYESPYAQNQDRRSQPPSESSGYITFSGTSTTRKPHSQQSSSSSGGSLYDSPGFCGSRDTTPGGTMSTQRTMSSVSRFLGIFLRFLSLLYVAKPLWISSMALEFDAVPASFRACGAFSAVRTKPIIPV